MGRDRGEWQGDRRNIRRLAQKLGALARKSGDPDKPSVRKLLRKVSTTAQISRLMDALDRILASDTEIRDVHWLANEEK